MSMHDLIIAGGGPVGLCAALAAHAFGLDVVVLERKIEFAGRDPRVFALSYGARLILERLGVWARIEHAHPIRVVEVSQRDRFGRTLLRADDLALDALGYVVAHGELMRALSAAVAHANIRCYTGARLTDVTSEQAYALARFEQAGAGVSLQAQVIAVADGGVQDSETAAQHVRTYGQCAIVADVAASRARVDHAYERFTPRGPIAMLPVGAHHALIWTVPESGSDDLLALDDGAFQDALVSAYGERIGVVTLRGPRAAFPLAVRFTRDITNARTVLIGNAAQTLHPVAGQGFNLGLRDAFELSLALGEHARDLLAGLARYRAGRRFDRTASTLFTDFLVRVFSNDLPLLGMARGAGLALLDAISPGKKFVMRRMMFGAPGQT
jgi:2-octaprenyl-6-methoxyphenol hydroxylase